MREYPFGTTSEYSGWTKTNESVTTTTSLDDGRDGEGFWTGGTVGFDVRTETTANYEATLATTLSAPRLGFNETDKVLITAVSFTRQQGAKATMSITSHYHAERRQYDGSYSWDLSPWIKGSGWGACDVPFGEELSAGNVVSIAYNFTLQHEEAQDCSGDHLDGEVYGPLIEVTVEVLGDTPVTLTQDDKTAGWHLVSTAVNTTAAGFTTATTVARKHLSKPAS